MFSIFRKKTQVEKLIAADGIEHATERFAQVVAKQIPNRQFAYQFILEELDGASRGNAASQLFAQRSGIDAAEYRDALSNSNPEVEVLQQMLMGLAMQISGQEQMAEFRCRVDENIMQIFSLGKYAKIQDRTEEMYESLKAVIMNDRSVIPALTSNIPVPENASMAHVHVRNRKRNLNAAQSLIAALSKATGEDSEEIIRHAILFKEFGVEKKSETNNLIFNGGMRLEEAEVDILFVVKNKKVIYINDDSDHLYERDKDVDERLIGRVVNMVFTGRSSKCVIEIFVAFDDSDSYTMFIAQDNLEERLGYVCQYIFKYFSEKSIGNIFSFAEEYSTQYMYSFKLYRKNGRHFMINNGQTQAYLIDEGGIERGGFDEVREKFLANIEI